MKKEKQFLKEDLNRMKKLSGLLKEAEGDFGISVGKYLEDELEGGELEKALIYLEQNADEIDEFIEYHTGGGDVQEAGKYIIKQIRGEQPIQEFNSINTEGAENGFLTFDELPEKVKEHYKRNIATSVAFVKKDGTVRHMAFRRSLKAYQKSEKEKTQAQVDMLKNNNLMNVYDTNSYIKLKRETGDPALAAKGSFRNFRLENVLAFLAGGELFDMRDKNKIKERFGEEIYDSLTDSMVSALKRDEVQGEIKDDSADTMVSESFVRGLVRMAFKMSKINK